MDLFNRPDRRPAAVVVTRDGRRLVVPVDELFAPRGTFRSLVLLVLGLIGGSRWEPGGRRRPRR